MLKMYHVELSTAERSHLRTLIATGRASAREIDRAQVLLLAHDGHTDQEIADRVYVGTTTVYRLRRRFAEEGLLATLHDRARPGGQPKLNGEQRALVVQLSSSLPPNGRPQWTMQQLADQLVALGAVDTISSKTVRRVLIKTAASAG